MKRLVPNLMFVCALALSLAVPASARAETTLQAIQPLSSVQVNYISNFNNQAGFVCQETWASASRIHGTCRELVTASYPEINIDLVTGRVREFIFYDDTYYERSGDETTWSATRIEGYDSSFTVNDLLFGSYLYPSNVVITNLGEAQVGGTVATQYQFWSTDSALNEASGGQVVYDVFVSAEGFVLKDQVSQRGSFPMGDGELNSIWTYSNFNQPLMVYAPPPSSVTVQALGKSRVTSLSVLRQR